MKLIYHLKDGEHEQPMNVDRMFVGLSFSNGVPATQERLRFYANSCNAHIELSQAELPPPFIPNVIPVKIKT